MKKDINIPEVKNVTVAIIRKQNEAKAYFWEVYLMNLSGDTLENILVVSHGYGEKDGKSVKTSTLRHYFEKLDAHSSMTIEPIDPEVFALNNEYGITYYINGAMHFKKFTFVTGSISEEYLSKIAVLGLEGVVHS